MGALGRVIAGLLSEPETQHLAHFEVRDGWGDVLVCTCVDTPEPADNKAHAHLAAFQKRKPRGEGAEEIFLESARSVASASPWLLGPLHF